MRVGQRLNIYAHQPRPTVDGPGLLVHLHNLYVCGRSAKFVSISLTRFSIPNAKATPRAAFCFEGRFWSFDVADIFAGVRNMEMYVVR